jgi:hypothetical protein
MDARRIVIVRRFGRRWLWCALGATLALGPGAASAQGSPPLPGKDPCSGNIHPTPIPNCQNQVSGPITFHEGDQYGIVYYCGGRDRTGTHLNFYVLDNGWAVAVDPVTAETCFQAEEEPGVERSEGVTNFFQGEFINTCNHDADLIVTLACSDTPQPSSD